MARTPKRAPLALGKTARPAAPEAPETDDLTTIFARVRTSTAQRLRDLANDRSRRLKRRVSQGEVLVDLIENASE